MRVDRAAASNGVKRAKHTHHWKPAAIVLDIEGTVAPISFVADVMFPYARHNVRTYLEFHYSSAETRADIDAIRKQVPVDVVGRHCGCVAAVRSTAGCERDRQLKAGTDEVPYVVLGCTGRAVLLCVWLGQASDCTSSCCHTCVLCCVVQAAADDQTFPTITASKAEVIDAVVAWVHEAIAQDRKVGALKQLQGHVWRAGFKKGQLTAELFRWGSLAAAGWTPEGLLVLCGCAADERAADGD